VIQELGDSFCGGEVIVGGSLEPVDRRGGVLSGLGHDQVFHKRVRRGGMRALVPWRISCQEDMSSERILSGRWPASERLGGPAMTPHQEKRRGVG